MNKLLLRQRKWLVIVLSIQAILIGVTITLYYYYPDFQYYFQVLIGLSSFFVAFDFISVFIFNLVLAAKKGKAELKSAEIIGNDISEAYMFGQIGLAVCDKENTVLWVNEFLTSRFSNLVDKGIFDVFPKLLELIDEKNPKDSVKISTESHFYQVELLKEARLFVFKDITEYENIFTYNQNQSPVIGYLSIDNYADVQISIGDETRFTDSLSELRKMIGEFGDNTNSLLRRIKDDRYLFITTMETYEKVLKDKFSIVDAVRQKFPGGFTISIGVAFGFPDYARLAKMASDALDVALSRGGDQTVVQPFGKQMIYLGGKTELQPSRNRVKVRTLSNSFLTILKDYKNVIIMPHDNADFDAIGSCLGVYLLCKYVGTPAKICWEAQHIEAKARNAVEGLYSKDEMEQMFVNMREVDDLVSDQALLVCCDHNNPKISIFPSLIQKCRNIAILDHHRPAQYVIENPLFNGVDTSASSASELVTFYITYNENEIHIDERTATLLLAGICLDTHFFKEHATINSFEASAQLKNFGADSDKVTDFLKEELEEYRQKISILNTAETPYYGCLVATCPDTEIVSSITLSVVANEALTIRGMSLSFCIGRIDEHTIKISGRSDGSVSVQLLIEKLGGGGHLAMAAVTMKEIHVEDAKARLMTLLKEYLDDARLK
jgi:cyclic-di-AMP phosphodiesterase